MTPEWEAAARGGDAETLERLLSEGADVNALDRYGQSALMLASVRGHTEVVELLIAAGAELDRTAKYRLSALMLAVINGHAQIVAALVAAGADRELRGSGAPGFDGLTALDLAERQGGAELVDALARPDEQG